MNDFKHKKLPSAIALAISSTLFLTACDNTPNTFTMGDVQTDSQKSGDKDKPLPPQKESSKDGTSKILMPHEVPYDKDHITYISKKSFSVDNQFVFKTTYDREQLTKILEKYPNLSIKVMNEFADRPALVYVEVKDENSAESKQQLKKLGAENNIDWEGKRFVIQDMHKPNFVPNEGDNYKFDDGGNNWHLEYLQMTKVWDITRGAMGRIVGVYDGGLNQQHEEITGKITEENIFTNYEEEEDKRERNISHGNAVASTILANTDNGVGVAGINHRADMVFTSFNSRTDRNFSNGINNLCNNGQSDVVNGSFGLDWQAHFSNHDFYLKNLFNVDYDNDNPQLASQVLQRIAEKDRDQFIQHLRQVALNYKRSKYQALHTINGRLQSENNSNINQDCLMVWAAGNDAVEARLGGGAIYYTQDEDNNFIRRNADDNVFNENIIVGAIINKITKDGKRHIAWYSNYGDDVDIYAPAEFKAAGGEEGHYYSKFDGTSSAAPVVSGVISLMRAVNPELSAQEIKEILIETADDMQAVQAIDHEYEETNDRGTIKVLNAYKAVYFARYGKLPPDDKIEPSPTNQPPAITNFNVNDSTSTGYAEGTITVTEPNNEKIRIRVHLVREEDKKECVIDVTKNFDQANPQFVNVGTFNFDSRTTNKNTRTQSPKDLCSEKFLVAGNYTAKAEVVDIHGSEKTKNGKAKVKENSFKIFAPRQTGCIKSRQGKKGDTMVWKTERCTGNQKGIIETIYQCDGNDWKYLKVNNKCTSQPKTCTVNGKSYKEGEFYNKEERCGTGFIGSGVTTKYTCGSDGQFTSKVTNNDCKKEDTPEPKTCTANGKVYPISRIRDEHKDCSTGFIGSGITTSYICRDNGTWEQIGEDNKCTKEEKPKPTVTANKVSKTIGFANQTDFTFTCNVENFSDEYEIRARFNDPAGGWFYNTGGSSVPVTADANSTCQISDMQLSQFGDRQVRFYVIKKGEKDDSKVVYEDENSTLLFTIFPTLDNLIVSPKRGGHVNENFNFKCQLPANGGRMPVGYSIWANFGNDKNGWLKETDHGGHVQFNNSDTCTHDMTITQAGNRKVRIGIFEGDDMSPIGGYQAEASFEVK